MHTFTFDSMDDVSALLTRVVGVLDCAEHKPVLLDAFAAVRDASPALRQKMIDVFCFPVNSSVDRVRRQEAINQAVGVYLQETLQVMEDADDAAGSCCDDHDDASSAGDSGIASSPRSTASATLDDLARSLTNASFGLDPQRNKVNKDKLTCSHAKSVCIHHYNAPGGCNLGEACVFCHQQHPSEEQARLAADAQAEYAVRGRQRPARPTAPTTCSSLVLARPVPGTTPATSPRSASPTAGADCFYTLPAALAAESAAAVAARESQIAAPDAAKHSASVANDILPPSQSAEYSVNGRVVVASYVDWLKRISFAIVFQFAVVLYSTQPNALRDAVNDIRKYLFHISRHAAVIAGVANVPIDGVSAGILLFRIAAHMESVPDTQFKTLVRQYVAFLESIQLKQSEEHIIKFHQGKLVLSEMDKVFFPGGFTFPLTVRDLPQNYKTKGPGGPNSGEIKFASSHDAGQSTDVDPLGKATPAINVRELHRRKLCVACRHYLRGMCYRGEACNFCHNPEHQAEYERSTCNQRLPEKK